MKYFGHVTRHDLFIYLLHLFTQGKPKQLTLVFIGALHDGLAKTTMQGMVAGKEAKKI